MNFVNMGGGEYTRRKEQPSEGPEAGMCLVFGMNSKEARVFGVEQVRQRRVRESKNYLKLVFKKLSETNSFNTDKPTGIMLLASFKQL